MVTDGAAEVKNDSNCISYSAFVLIQHGNTNWSAE